MLLFWVDETAAVTPDEDAAMLIAVGSWLEEMTEHGAQLGGGPLRSAREARIVRVRNPGQPMIRIASVGKSYTNNR